MITRRTFVKGTVAGLASGGALAALATQAAEQAPYKLRIGSCMIGLEQAKEAGLDGAEVRVGEAAEKLQISDPAVQQKYKEQMEKTGLVIPSFMMGLLNSYPLATDPRGPAWLEQSIDAAKVLGAKVILVAFFGNGDLYGKDGKTIKQDELDVVVKRLKAAAPRAKDAGVFLGVESWLTAKENLNILERVNHDSVKIYFDVGNMTVRGYDVPTEIRKLKGQICQIHFKDADKYLGEGGVKFDAIAPAIREIGYDRWIVMETASPSKNAVADAKRNAAFIRKLFGMA